MSIFTKTNMQKPTTNKFDLTHDRKMSASIGKLTPFLVMDTIPGDKINMQSHCMVRFAPLIAPVMHKVKVYMHYFFVPNRLVWPNWEDFITGGEDGDSDPTWPHINLDWGEAQILPSSLADYLGVPNSNGVGGATPRKISAIPFAAYQKIYNDYYRDQNLIDPVTDQLSDGANGLFSLNQLRNRAWQHDYFTSALPFTQKGPEAMIPIGGEAPLKLIDPSGPVQQRVQDANNPGIDVGGTLEGAGQLIADAGTQVPAYLTIESSHVADLSSITASSIIELRRAFKLQEWLEKNARGGSRYIESIQVHFGVQSSDKRLQRAEYIGGYSAPVQISEVLNSTGPTADPETQDWVSPQGSMAGHGIAVGGGKRMSYYCEEHGYLIGLMSVMPKTAYQQGIPRHFMRRDKFDYAWPEFAHIGEQAIEAAELFQQPGTDGLDTWGYAPRYAEYKYLNDTVHGDFRTSLDFWHMGRKFTSLPNLNKNFIECTENEVDRIFAVKVGDENLWAHVLNNVEAERKLPYFGNPKM